MGKWSRLGALAIGCPIGVASACSTFTATDDVADASVDPHDAAVTDASDASASLAPMIRWSFDGTGAASTSANGDTFLTTGADYAPGVSGQSIHCAAQAFAATPQGGAPFEIGTGDATFILWVSLDANSELDGSTADRLHTFFDRNMNWGSSVGKDASGYGLGYIHDPVHPYLQGAITDGVTFMPVIGHVDLSDAKFHMVAFVVEQKMLTLYADGAFVGQATVERTGPIGNGTSAGPIRLCDIFSSYLRGSLDELMIFQRALTAQEIGQVKTDVETMK